MSKNPAIAADAGIEGALLAKYEAVLSAFSICDDTLIPQHDLGPLAAALSRRMQPATANDRTVFIGLIGSAWPLAHQRVDADTLEFFIRQLEGDLTGFPADILMAVLRDLRRTLIFSPSISEIYRPAKELLDRRKSALRAVERHQREHERRAELARKDVERAARYREEQQGRLDRLIAIYGDAAAAWTVDDLDVAITGMLRLPTLRTYRPWLEAFENGDRWALDVLPVAVVMGAAHEPHCRAPIRTAALCRSLDRVRRDPSCARQAIDELCTDAFNDARDAVGDPDGLFAEIVAEIRRACELSATAAA